MPSASAAVVVAGHICLDIIPTFGPRRGTLADVLVPGALVEIGPAVLSTGGPVSNTGLALHRLGIRTRLMGKIGDDLFGHAVRRIVEDHEPGLSQGMLVTPGAHTSYSVVVSPPGVDRIFLHCPGANDTFGAEDVPYDELCGSQVFHFGYPPLMRRMYADNGQGLETLFAQVKQRGLITSLDLARPDPASDAGRADWPTILARTLPYVDLFLPSIDEVLFMLDRPRYDRLSLAGGLLVQLDGALLADIADRLLALRAGVVALKLGDRGLYVRTSGTPARLAALRPLLGSCGASWVGRELLSPCFDVGVVGTTGCGDATIAGFLAGLLQGFPLERVMTAAVAVGACNVERADALSGIPTWSAVQGRIAAGWARRAGATSWPGWTWNEDNQIACGPRDREKA